MESDQSVRRIQRRYLCQKCNNVYSKLVETYEDFTQCPNCDWMGEEVSEEVYKKLKNKPKDSSPPNNNQRFNQNFNNNDNERNHTNHRAPNVNNMNQGQGYNPFHSIFNDSLFGPFFQSPFSSRIIRYQFGNSNNFFMPEFSQFGSTNNSTFQDNFSSNFRSNILDLHFWDDILAQMQQSEKVEKPTSRNALSKLKVFKMDKSYCKEDKGKVENPNCIVCMADIEIGADTLMIPCGHMFHDKCVKLWLEKHNTCPVCRFELPTD